MEAHGQPAVLLLLDELVRPVVPDLNAARAVLALRDLTGKRCVLDRVVLDVDGERALTRLERNACLLLRFSPLAPGSLPFALCALPYALRVC